MRKNIIVFVTLGIFITLPIISLAKLNKGPDEGILIPGAAGQDITKEMPSGDFINPQKKEKPEEKEKLKGEEKVELKVENAQSVEFYLRRPEALTETYLGKGNLKKDDVWEYSWQTNSTPNGSYFLSPKINNEFGEYSGQKILIDVDNTTKRKPKEEEKFQNLQVEIKKTESEIKNKEQEIDAEKETINKEVSKKVEELIARGETLVKEEKREETKPEIREKAEKFSQEVKKGIEKVLEVKEKEEQEKIKKEVVEGLKGVTQPIIEAAKEENKTEARRLEAETKKEIETVMEEKLEKTLEKKQKSEEKKEEFFAKDTDGDGLPDNEELRLGTDPVTPDSDGDGFLDGSEIALGFDPLNPSPADRIKFQSPEKEKPKISEILKVDKVEATVLEGGESALKIQGKALPNIFVTIYIYSSPLVMVVKADSNGNWEYILDKPLAEGQHRVYATVTNNKGDIEESSEAYAFLMSGGKVLRLFEAAGAGAISPAETLQKSFAILVIAIVIFTLGTAFILIGVILRKKPRP